MSLIEHNPCATPNRSPPERPKNGASPEPDPPDPTASLLPRCARYDMVRIPLSPEVFSAREIARAARTSTADAEALLASGVVPSVEGFVIAQEAVRAVLMLRGLPAGPGSERTLFSPLWSQRRRKSGPLTMSGLLHVTA